MAVIVYSSESAGLNLPDAVVAVVGLALVEADVTTADPWHCVILSVSSVTAAVRAYNPPLTEMPVVTVIEVCARMFPAKVVPVPRVAELPTCQKTLQALAPLIRRTEEADAVVRVLPI